MQDWDVVIAGAGLAGLSLAAELAEQKFSHLQVLLVEPRKHHIRDRTWSYWALPEALPSRWQSLPAAYWPRWKVSMREQSVTSKQVVQYASVRADNFYDEALQMIAKAPNIHWLHETSITGATARAQGIELATSTGQQFSSKSFFDSRPPAPISPNGWVQHFQGWEVETKGPSFEPECLDLMAFEPSSQGLHFLYCLPYSSTRALVESTWISRGMAPTDYEAQLRHALQQRWAITDFNVVFREHGALPLTPKLHAAQPGWIRIGRAGGMLRAATGYAFCATLQQTSSLAASLDMHLKHGGLLHTWQAPAHSHPALDQWMDQVLFRVIERDWLQAPQYFLSLFDKVPELSLIRFLQGQANWQDRLAVMRALPAWPFVRAAVG